MRGSGLVYLGIGLLRETQMPQDNRDPKAAEAGQQVPARPHDSGSAANETVMDSMPRPKSCGAPPKIRRLVPRPKTLRTSRCLIGLV
jgi:hypothetical protein